MEAPLKIMLDTFLKHVSDAGTMSFVDTGGLLPVMGDKDCPGGREIIVRMLPTLLRSQKKNGGWGDGSFKIIRALMNHGLFDALRGLPSLPRDWEIVRSLPLPPDAEVYGLTWGDQALWVCDRAKKRGFGRFTG